LPVHARGAVGRGHGGRVDAAQDRGTGQGERAAHDGRLHRRGGGPPDRAVQPRGAGRRGAGGRRSPGGQARPRAFVRARDHQGLAEPGGEHGPARRARGGGADPGVAHAAPGLSGGVRGLRRQARSGVPVRSRERLDRPVKTGAAAGPVVTEMPKERDGLAAPDTGAVRAFLDARHGAWVERVRAFAGAELRDRPEPADDDRARTEARVLLGLMGAAGLYEPIGALDLRGCCLAREAVASASPLADAVWALQGLGLTPRLTAGTREQRARWAAPALDATRISAFALTAPD